MSRLLKFGVLGLAFAVVLLIRIGKKSESVRKTPIEKETRLEQTFSSASEMPLVSQERLQRNEALTVVAGEDQGLPSIEQLQAHGQLLKGMAGLRSPEQEPALRDRSFYVFSQSSDNSKAFASNPIHSLNIQADSQGIQLYLEDGYLAEAIASGLTSEERPGLELRLRSFGHGESLYPNTEGAYKKNRNRLEKSHPRGITEWWENKPEGMEHGYLVREPLPSSSIDSELRFELEIETAYAIAFDEQRQELIFESSEGMREMTYGKLIAWDANGDALPGSLEVSDSIEVTDSKTKVAQVFLTIDTANAVYPLTIDPLICSHRVANVGSSPSILENDAVVLGDAILFPAASPESGIELWIADESPDGARMLKDIYPGTGSSFPRNFISIGSKALFTAANEENGYELWKTDGTSEGTVLLADIYHGPEGSSIGSLTAVDERVYFIADSSPDGVSEYLYSLWQSDGTPEGTSPSRTGYTRPSLGPDR